MFSNRPDVLKANPRSADADPFLTPCAFTGTMEPAVAEAILNESAYVDLLYVSDTDRGQTRASKEVTA